MTNTFSNRSNAARAARKALGADAKLGTDFTLTVEADGKVTWAKVEPVQAPKAAKAARRVSKKAQVLEAAMAGRLPTTPDFSANTHKAYRGKLATLVSLVEAGDLEALKAFPINPYSTSPKALNKYRNLAVLALEAKAQKVTA